MRKTLRLGLLIAAAATSLAFASSALGTYAPKLMITRGNEFTDITFSQTDADDPTAKVQILAPAGYSASLSQAPGTQLGTMGGSVIAGDFGGATVPVAGTIVAGDPSNPALQATAKQCTNAEQHAAIWLLNVTAAGQSLPAPVPLFVDPVSGTFSPFGSVSIQLCLPPPPLAAFKIKLLEATLQIANDINLIGPPTSAGSYRWTAINTPYKGDNSVNPAGTVETQGLDGTPVDPGLTAKRITKTRRVKHKRFTDIFYTYFVRLSGTIRVGGEPIRAATVDIFADDPRPFDETGTNDGGAFTQTYRLTRTSSYNVVYSRDAAVLAGGACVPQLELLPGVVMPCVSVSRAGFSASSEEVRVVKPKLTHRRVKNKGRK